MYLGESLSVATGDCDPQWVKNFSFRHSCSFKHAVSVILHQSLSVSLQFKMIYMKNLPIWKFLDEKMIQVIKRLLTVQYVWSSSHHCCLLELKGLLMSLRTTSPLVSSKAVITLSSNGERMPLECSRTSPVTEEFREALWVRPELEEWTEEVVTRDDFLVLFCVAVRLQSEFSASRSLPQHR